MKSRLLRDMDGAITPEHPRGRPLPAGTVIDHPQAWLHVLAGFAEPADDECRVKVLEKSDPDYIRDGPRRYERTVRGIAPEDYGRYDRGEILGYYPDGSYIPGPNWEEDEEDE